MIIKTMNASEDELWQWFDLPGGGSVHLKMVSRDELSLWAKSVELPAQAKIVGEKFFDDFKGLKDRKGNAIENTPANRVAMLSYRPLWSFVVNTLTELSNWVEEGKDDSGTAS